MSGRWGLMVHWIAPGPAAEQGPYLRDLNAAVDRFDVPRLLAQFAGTGADWLIFTIGQNTGFYASPNATFDRLAGPGHCARRDLVLELARGVTALGRRFICYLPAESKWVTPLHAALAWNPADQSEYERRYTAFIREYSLRLGRLNSGWWYDGCYNWKAYRQAQRHWELWCDASRAGNPDAALAFNDGSYCCGRETPITPLQDFLSGEIWELHGDHRPLRAGDGLPVARAAADRLRLGLRRTCIRSDASAEILRLRPVFLRPPVPPRRRRRDAQRGHLPGRPPARRHAAAARADGGPPGRGVGRD
jgi:hypothetical protein